MRAHQDGNMMSAGQYGLLRSNDPDVVWSGSPEIEPPEDEHDQWLKWAVGPRAFESTLILRPEVGWDLVEAATRCGYDRGEHGSLAYWLWDHMAKRMKQGWPRHHGTGEEIRT
jgi:hypothetical protein